MHGVPSVGAHDFLAVAVEAKAGLGELGTFQQRPEVVDVVLLHPLRQGSGESGLG